MNQDRYYYARNVFDMPIRKGVVIAQPQDKHKVRWGVKVGKGSAWIGVHWSKHNRRFCINLVPFLTIWITLKGGKTPYEN